MTNSTTYKSLDEVTDEDIANCAAWWAEKCLGWIGDRAIPVWLTYEGGFAWNPDDESDSASDVLIARRVQQAWTELLAGKGDQL